MLIQLYRKFMDVFWILKQNSQQHTKFFHKVGCDIVIPSLIRGIGHLYDSRLNKGLAFTIEERQKLGIHGMLPPKVRTQDDQYELVLEELNKYDSNTKKYLFLQDLQLQNERLYFRVIIENIEEMIPIIYTPTLHLSCINLNVIYRRPRGIFISLYDLGHCLDILKNWPEPVATICLTDGSRIFGLGDLGAYGIAIPAAKLSLYTVAARIKPFCSLPVVIDVGTNNEKLLGNKAYIGLNRKRASDVEEEELIDDFINAAIVRFGDKIVIQFEDFKSKMGFRLLEKYRHKACAFNGDIQASGSLVLAGLWSAMKILKKQLSDNKFLFLGSGQPAIGTADLCVNAMMAKGLTQQEALDKIWIIDHHGLLVKSRPGIEDYIAVYAKDHEPMKELNEVVKKLRPTVLIGMSKKDGAFTPEVLSDMAKYSDSPIIFAMGNPCGKPECTALEAYEYTNGQCVFASSQPFPTVSCNGNNYETGCANSAMVFPGIVLGAMLCGIQKLDDEIFLIISQVLADVMTKPELDVRKVYPSVKKLPECALAIAESIICYAHQNDLARIRPQPKDIIEFIKKEQYSYKYEDECPLPAVYPWVNLKEIEKAKDLKYSELYRPPF